MDLLKGGFVKGRFVKGGFVKHGFVKGGFVKGGFLPPATRFNGPYGETPPERGTCSR